MTLQQLLKAFLMKNEHQDLLDMSLQNHKGQFFSSFQRLGAPLPQVFNCYIPVRQKQGSLQVSLLSSACEQNERKTKGERMR